MMIASDHPLKTKRIVIGQVTICSVLLRSR